VTVFSSVLIANRGEIAVRIARTLTARGIRSVAVYTPADADALHVRGADVAVAIDSYLRAGAVVEAAVACEAEAVHPGYGFLSEDAGFARAVLGAGLTWIGPPPEAIELMGDKIRAKSTVAAAGVPIVPGTEGSGLSDAELVDAAGSIGFPVLVKPAAGGGGKGMRRVETAAALPGEIAAARREAAGAFGDDTLLLERWVRRPRHIEVQVFADAMGGVVHQGERESSLQLRHQTIVEASPSPVLDDAMRRSIGASAVAVARSCGYVGAGTVEFIVSAEQPDEPFYMEMNTRLQVEHPVTELVTGIDLVDWQLRIAAGQPLPAAQDQIRIAGHAVEARVYAEDPRRGFLPATGTVLALDEPIGRPGVRVDSALAEGTVVGTGYDPMLAKVIAWGEDRGEALARLRSALAATTVLGVTTNVGFLVALLGHPDVVAGRLDTELVERVAGDLTAPGADDDDAVAAAACLLLLDREPTGPVVDPWDLPDGWRLGEPAETVLALRRDGDPLAVAVTAPLTDARVRVDGKPPAPVAARRDGGDLMLTAAGATTRWSWAVAGEDVWVGRGGHAWRLGPDRPTRRRSPGADLVGGTITSPMPGTVVATYAAAGDRVGAGQPLVAVEAMKMEHTVVAPLAGTVAELLVRSGQSVGLDELLAVVTPAEEG
jgi:acetyl-CoA/propionyl-CoA carboxylase biotin carboxyl carrier protein